MTKRRPRNIMDSLKSTDIEFIMTGDGRMSDIAHMMVHNAWSSVDKPRQLFIKVFCKQRSSDERSTRIVFLMLGMLEYAGMQPAAFIHALLLACPWVIQDVPLLAPAFSLYVESVKAFASADADFRPYLKLYHGNASQIFHSKSLQDLNAVAVMWLAANVPSMKKYKAPGGTERRRHFLLQPGPVISTWIP